MEIPCGSFWSRGIQKSRRFLFGINNRTRTRIHSVSEEAVLSPRPSQANGEIKSWVRIELAVAFFHPAPCELIPTTTVSRICRVSDVETPIFKKQHVLCLFFKPLACLKVCQPTFFERERNGKIACESQRDSTTVV